MLGLGNSLIAGSAQLEKQSNFSILFDGSNDYIKTGGNASTKPTSALTVSAWVNMDTASGGYGWPNPDGNSDHNQVVVGVIASGGYALAVHYSGTAANPITHISANARPTNNGSGLSNKYFSDAFYNASDGGYEASASDAGLTGGGTTDGAPVNRKGCAWGGYTSGTNTLHNIRNLTGWNHLAMTYGAGVIKLYINGALKRTADTGVSSNNLTYNSNSAAEVMIGADLGSVPSGGAEFLDGLIDDVAIWSAAIDADGISKIYNNGAGGTTFTSADGDYDNQSDLEAWYTFEEGTGTSVADSSTNSNTGTLVNGPAFSTNTAG